MNFKKPTIYEDVPTIVSDSTDQPEHYVHGGTLKINLDAPKIIGKWVMFKNKNMCMCFWEDADKLKQFKRPNAFRRFMAWLILDWKWKDGE